MVIPTWWSLVPARELAGRSLEVRVLEAAPRPGGRAFIESATFGIPFDHGASWITSANENPHTALARQHGLDLIDYSDAPETLFVVGREAGDEEYAQYFDAFDAINGNIKAAVWSGQDRAASTVVPDVPFARTAQTRIGPRDLGVVETLA